MRSLMAIEWTLTFDAANPPALAAFWRLALGYVEASPPAGFGNWEEWFRRFGVPENEWNDIAAIEDPDGVGPRISFLKVPERKAAKNRVHLDIQAGGGRSTPREVRWPRVMEIVERLTAAGATVIQIDEDVPDGTPDHVFMADPEGNEFCVV
jgi:catechol 2,3-dioxygenase-like lactoylglutathione lyase family enzyme